MTNAKEKICLALDVDSGVKAVELIKQTKEYVGIYKVGLQLFTKEGIGIIQRIHDLGGKVFLDLKYHDIETTVVKAAIEATRLGVHMFNVHTVSGYETMRKTACVVKNEAARLGIPEPIVLGVTVLTSIDETRLVQDMCVATPLRDYVLHLATMAQRAQIDGVVCSPNELLMLKDRIPKPFLYVTPGVRPEWASANDQKRVATPYEAIRDGADVIVVGRPITDHNNPAFAAQLIYEEVQRSIISIEKAVKDNLEGVHGSE